MAHLAHTVREIDCPDGNTATVVELDGSVDPASLDEFDAIFDELLENGTVRVVMDLGKLKYINSTGMGMMVQYYDQLSDEGGGLVLLAVQAKVILVLEMLGLQELFPIVASEEEAVAALMGEEVTPASVQVRLEEQDTPVHERGGVNVTCGSCGAELIIAGAGDYLCPRCRALLEVDSSNNIHTCSPVGDDSVEISIPSAVPFYKSAAALLARIGIKCGLGDAEVVAAATSIQDVLTKMTELCLGEEDSNIHRLQLMANCSGGAFDVYVYCAGRSLSSSSDLDGSAAGFDTVDYSPVSGGNIVKLSKSVG